MSNEMGIRIDKDLEAGGRGVVDGTVPGRLKKSTLNIGNSCVLSCCA